MDIIQDEVTGNSILFKSVIARFCDYVFSGPYSLRGVRIVYNNCIILYMCPSTGD